MQRIFLKNTGCNRFPWLFGGLPAVFPGWCWLFLVVACSFSIVVPFSLVVFPPSPPTKCTKESMIFVFLVSDRLPAASIRVEKKNGTPASLFVSKRMREMPR